MNIGTGARKRVDSNRREKTDSKKAKRAEKRKTGRTGQHVRSSENWNRLTGQGYMQVEGKLVKESMDRMCEKKVWQKKEIFDGEQFRAIDYKELPNRDHSSSIAESERSAEDAEEVGGD